MGLHIVPVPTNPSCIGEFLKGLPQFLAAWLAEVFAGWHRASALFRVFPAWPLRPGQRPSPLPSLSGVVGSGKEARQNKLAISPIDMVCLALCRTPSHRPSQQSLLS